MDRYRQVDCKIAEAIAETPAGTNRARMAQGRVIATLIRLTNITE
jgi:hypothetical protein